ncbi:Hypothetical protein NTJ_06974 [Nesidiocoris tenuis]|uniref:Uncharacterized protein n=1 Tax=Nesidiocoris tenuis TaxID=355587 RepID=A0ABN7APM0_9HEMI|nr:Hypothetical protein NTJ_06974 [Nesidiocoris tenuis]
MITSQKGECKNRFGEKSEQVIDSERSSSRTALLSPVVGCYDPVSPGDSPRGHVSPSDSSANWACLFASYLSPHIYLFDVKWTRPNI